MHIAQFLSRSEHLTHSIESQSTHRFIVDDNPACSVSLVAIVSVVRSLPIDAICPVFDAHILEVMHSLFIHRIEVLGCCRKYNGSKQAI